uniref:Structural maintenance of chromosomes protein 6 n=1 Tax=Sphaeramia orbicularis TaxID=375764 RepID=A0A673AXA0_9TELE
MMINYTINNSDPSFCTGIISGNSDMAAEHQYDGICNNHVTSIHCHILCFCSLQCASKVESDAGIVESITLKNFMCHSHLGPFTFGPNVNFIVGNNGSGKSAVLTALIVTLGGNAQATNRGSSLKGFVKEGEGSADVSITLRNKGRDAFKPEVYGSSIIVDLRITREGLRTYKMKNKSGQIVTTKKEELLSILDNFNVQVNNPVSVLTQEMSKYFLHSKGEGDKYKFFMKATQLEQMREDFFYIKSTKSVTEDKVGQYSECLKDLKRTYLEKEDRYKSLASLDEMHTKLEELQKQMAWALVGSFTHFFIFWNFHHPLPLVLFIEEAEKKYKEIQEQLDKITQQVQELQPKCAELKAEAQHCNTLLKSSEVSMQSLYYTALYLGYSLHWKKSKSDQVYFSHFESKYLITLKIRPNHLKIQHPHPSDFRREQDMLQRSIETNRRNLQTMESSRSNRLRRFGEHMPDLLNAIQDAHKRGQFKQKPRGPLGFLISLKDPELALAVEVCLKGQLQAFTCDNYEDEKVLQGIMFKVFPKGRRPTIITSRFLQHVHDTKRRAVNHPQYPSVLQALEIEDPVVANCLIDQRGIESILLIKNRTEARRLMQGKNPPHNCTSAFSKDGDQIFTNRTYTADQTRANYLSGDVEEEIRHYIYIEYSCVTTRPQEEDLEEIITKITSKRAEYEEARIQMADLKASYEKAEREYKQHKEQINTIAEEADPIKEDLSKTDQEVLKCKHHKKHYDEKRNVQLRNIQTLKESLKSKEQELQESVTKAKLICPERLEVRRSARSLDTEISRLKVKITTQQEHQGDREEILRQYNEALENYTNMVQHVKNLNSFIKKLDSVMNQRQHVYAEFRRFLSARCKYYFDSMLSQRGYTGSMTFDHKNETLSISVQPGQGKQADMSDMRSLSGGERSFSTVCFVLSLWAITEAPFRCLDEFDVYMDMVNRRISMDMMLKVAAGQSYRQFIFLTPQNMSSLPESENINILRLKDPDRGQNNASQGPGK